MRLQLETHQYSSHIIVSSSDQVLETLLRQIHALFLSYLLHYVHNRIWRWLDKLNLKAQPSDDPQLLIIDVIGYHDDGTLRVSDHGTKLLDA